MGLKLSLGNSAAEVVVGFESVSGRLQAALVEKMTALMTRLQQKAQAAAPVRSGTLRDSIRNPQASAVGNKIIGTLEWGGPSTTSSYKGGKLFDYSQIVELGAVAHPINPLTTRGTRLHQKNSPRRFGSDILSNFYDIYKESKFISATGVHHPGVTGTHFMGNALESMRSEIVSGLSQTINGVLADLRKKKF